LEDEADSAAGHVAVDKAICEWRQGDCVLGEHFFVYRDTSPSLESGNAPVETTGDNIEIPVEGFVVVTQTCDILRSSSERPFVEVCPLVLIETPALFPEISKGRRPQYGAIPSLADRNLAADLDRTMTIPKAVLATWERIPGWASDAEARTFADALTRKRGRFAFPDAFTELVDPLRKRLQEKHDKQSPEGEALRALREIRVTASPSWDASEVTLTF